MSEDDARNDSHDGGNHVETGDSGADSGIRQRFGFLERKRERESGDGDGDDSSNRSGNDGVGTREDSGNTGIPASGTTASGGDTRENSSDSRTDSETASDSGRIRGDDTGRVYSGRGRHPRNCQCPKHRGSFHFGETGSETGTRGDTDPVSRPRTVAWEEIFEGFGGTTGKFALSDALVGFYDLGFEVVATRRGEHWKLTKEESTRLGRTTALCLKTLPMVKAKFIKRLEKTAPWIALGMTGFLVIYKRALFDAAVKMEVARRMGNYGKDSGTVSGSGSAPIGAAGLGSNSTTGPSKNASPAEVDYTKAVRESPFEPIQ